MAKAVELLKKRVVKNKIINYPKHLHNKKDSGAVGKFVEDYFIDSPHGNNTEDIKGLELKTKDIESGNDISIAGYNNPVEMFERTYNKIKKRIGYIQYKIRKDKIHIVSFKIYEKCTLINFKIFVRSIKNKSKIKYRIYAKDLPNMYEKELIII